MSKFVSFWAYLGSGTTFMGNMVIPDFEIQCGEDVKKIESHIKSECNRGRDHHDKQARVEIISLVNWKAL